MKLIISFLIEDNVFSFKEVCNINYTKFTDIFFNAVEIALYILTNEYFLII